MGLLKHLATKLREAADEAERTVNGESSPMSDPEKTTALDALDSIDADSDEIIGLLSMPSGSYHQPGSPLTTLTDYGDWFADIAGQIETEADKSTPDHDYIYVRCLSLNKTTTGHGPFWQEFQDLINGV